MDSSISNLLGSINSLINTNNSGSDPRSTLDVHTKDFADYDSDSDSIGEGDLISTPTNTYILGRIFSPSPELSSYSNSIYKFTYRSGFSEMKPYGYTTDKGWGCMFFIFYFYGVCVHLFIFQFSISWQKNLCIFSKFACSIFF